MPRTSLRPLLPIRKAWMTVSTTNSVAKISPASQTTYGGVKIDLKARAVTETGKVIPGLYVSGEAASQYGQGVSIGVILGKLAADTAAEDIAKMK